MIEYLLIAVILNVLIGSIAYFKQTDKLTDMTYCITFIILTVILLTQSTLTVAHIIVASIIFLWALRLGAFLSIRIYKQKKDDRFDNIRPYFLKFIAFWLAQAVLAWILLLPTIYLMQTTQPTLWWIGILISALGILVEAVADTQKYKFKQKHKTFIHTGLWRLSRHPNYFGEILVWVGLYISIIPALSPTQVIISILSPLAIYLMLRYISGIPLLEKKADNKYGHLIQYRKYKQQTNMLIPWIPRK